MARLPARRDGVFEQPVHPLALRPRVGENAGGRVADSCYLYRVIRLFSARREEIQVRVHGFVRLVPEVRLGALANVGVQTELGVERLPAALPRAHHVVVGQTAPTFRGVVHEARRMRAFFPRARAGRQRGEQVRVERLQEGALAVRQRHRGGGGGLGRNRRARGRGREPRRDRRSRHDHGRRFGVRERRLRIRRTRGRAVEERGGEHHDQRRDDGDHQ